MPRPVTIVTYHYVRDLERTRYREIKGLTVQHFKEQIEYMDRFYTFITVDDFMASLGSSDSDLPRNAAILSFDDGYIDHYLNAFPIMEEKGIQGFFFPPAMAVVDHRVLDVNKIHFVLASIADKSVVVSEILASLDEWRQEFGLESNQEYYRAHAIPSRFDTREVVFIKRMLQKALPLDCRTRLCDKLFRKYVTHDEEAFAAELYMNVDQLKCMARNGMCIGSHSYNHVWLDSLTPADQEIEINSSLQIMGEFGCDLDRWTMCYPYNSYDQSLLSLLRTKNCKLGMTGKVGIADLEEEDPLLLSRLDTNDLPKDRAAPPNEWTLKVLN